MTSRSRLALRRGRLVRTVDPAEAEELTRSRSSSRKRWVLTPTRRRAGGPGSGSTTSPSGPELTRPSRPGGGDLANIGDRRRARELAQRPGPSKRSRRPKAGRGLRPRRSASATDRRSRSCTELAGLDAADDPWFCRAGHPDSHPFGGDSLTLGAAGRLSAGAGRRGEHLTARRSGPRFAGVLDLDVQLVWGPPGTGKTHFLAVSILCLVEAARKWVLPVPGGPRPAARRGRGRPANAARWLAVMPASSASGGGGAAGGAEGSTARRWPAGSVTSPTNHGSSCGVEALNSHDEVVRRPVGEPRFEDVDVAPFRGTELSRPRRLGRTRTVPSPMAVDVASARSRWPGVHSSCGRRSRRS